MFALLARPGSFPGSTAVLRHGGNDPGAALLHCARERVLGRSLRPQRTFWRSRRYGSATGRPDVVAHQVGRQLPGHMLSPFPKSRTFSRERAASLPEVISLSAGPGRPSGRSPACRTGTRAGCCFSSDRPRTGSPARRWHPPRQPPGGGSSCPGWPRRQRCGRRSSRRSAAP